VGEEAGTRLAINSLTGAAEDHELALGFRTQTAGSFTLSAVTRQNLEDVTLTDNVAGIEFDLTSGDYTFTSGVTDNADRFTVTFRAKIPTKDNSKFHASKFQVYTNGNGQIVIKQASPEILKFEIFNVSGQKLYEENPHSTYCILHVTFPSGVYFVQAGSEIKKVIVK
jgi:hypothetical protein